MTTEIYRKALTGKESNSDLDNLIEKYFNPQKIKNLRFVFVLKHSYENFTRKVDCYQFENTWIRVNYKGSECLSTQETNFNDLIKRTRKSMEMPRNFYIKPEKFYFVVYGDNE